MSTASSWWCMSSLCAAECLWCSCYIFWFLTTCPGHCQLSWVLVIHPLARPCIPLASCAVMDCPGLSPGCPNTFPGLPLVSWGDPAPSPDCSLPSLGCPCCLCAQTHHSMTSAQTCPAVDLRIRHVGCHELLRKSSLVCLVCSLAISLRSDG